MKKIVFIVLLVIGSITVWLCEPYSYIPFYSPTATVVDSSFHYICKTEGELNNRQQHQAADNIVNHFMSAKAFVGVSTGFYASGCGGYFATAGYMDKGGMRKTDKAMISRVASITKPMTAIAIMQLYEQGKLELDVPIQHYLPTFPRLSKNDMTIRHLLSHTAGIPHYASKLDALSFTHYLSLQEAVDTIAERGIIGEPGSQFVYSSFGYTLLGAIIEKVSGLSFEDYLYQNIWQVAGMSDTSLERPDMLDNKNKSRLYIKLGGIFLRSPHTDLSIIYPAGGVQSTAQDLLKFGDAIIKNQLIRRETLEQMIDVRYSLAPASGDDPYGLGWVVYHDPTRGRIMAHSGAQPGVSSYLEIHLDDQLVIATLSNAFGTKNSVLSLTRDIKQLAQQIKSNDNNLTIDTFD